MTHTYDRAQTLQYFSSFADLFTSYANESNLHPRDRLLLEKILSDQKSRLTVIDYGCGGGHLLASLAQRGHNVTGIEPNAELAKLATQKLERFADSKNNVRLGGIETLSNIAPASVDLFVSMGVFQYLPGEEYVRTLQHIRRVLKPDGRLVCTFQNALFDLITFNKYTVDFFEHQLFPPLQELGLNLPNAVKSLETLIPCSELPHFTKSRARDNIFVRLSNPLTIGAELRRFGFELADLYFYEFQPVPPLIAADLGDQVREIAAALEVEKAQEWYAYFIGSAFLTHCRPALESQG
jgi:SAM-dependent methyltransferase